MLSHEHPPGKFGLKDPGKGLPGYVREDVHSLTVVARIKKGNRWVKSGGVPGIRGTPLAGERMVWRQEWIVALGSSSVNLERLAYLILSFHPSSPVGS